MGAVLFVVVSGGNAEGTRIPPAVVCRRALAQMKERRMRERREPLRHVTERAKGCGGNCLHVLFQDRKVKKCGYVKMVTSDSVVFTVHEYYTSLVLLDKR